MPGAEIPGLQVGSLNLLCPQLGQARDVGLSGNRRADGCLGTPGLMAESHPGASGGSSTQLLVL